MKTLRKILISLFLLLTVVFISLYFYVKANGRQVVLKVLNAGLSQPATIEDVEFVFPFGLSLKNLKIEKFFEVKELDVQCGFPLLGKDGYNIASLRFISPRLFLQKNEEGEFSLLPVLKKENPVPAAPPSENAQPLAEVSEPALPLGSLFSQKFDGVAINALEIRNGELEFHDASNPSFKFSLKQVGGWVRNFHYPFKPLRTAYAFAAVMNPQNTVFQNNQLKASGWVDFYRKGMNGKIRMTDPDGKEVLIADLDGENNDLTVLGKVNFKNMQAAKPDKEKDFSVEDMLFTALQSSDIDINMDFKIRTKFDDFELSRISFSGKVGYDGQGGMIKNREIAPAAPSAPPEENKAE
ncbi:MAG: hypothetical protein A2Z88_02300 [Omnitrophica WOR_2 bacterium GWA2_47_8]|nr:MAG: hypothetical protein A2Z88_02300 [Omnitrophica WOR_2 bacterium GWA2_47_8]